MLEFLMCRLEKRLYLANVAQLVAQLIRNQQVRGSSPLVGSSRNGDTGYRNSLLWIAIFLCPKASIYIVNDKQPQRRHRISLFIFVGSDIFYSQPKKIYC